MTRYWRQRELGSEQTEARHLRCPLLPHPSICHDKAFNKDTHFTCISKTDPIHPLYQKEMPTRLDSRSRSFSRPPPVSSKTHSAPVTLSDLPDGDEDEWEPRGADEAALSLDEIRDNITTWENDLRAKGREISGRTM